MPKPTASAQHESPNISTLEVITIIAGLFLLVGLAVLMVALMLKLFGGSIEMAQAPVPAFPEPRLQLSSQADLAELQRRDEQRLHRDAAIPIEKAMELIVQRGQEAFSPLAPARASAGGQP
jgi:hypothetical protein